MWNNFWSTLPEAGGSDGLRRMGRTPAHGNLRAKTGTLNHVSALSGYVRAANNEMLAFSIIGNNVPSTWRAKRVEDALGVRLARFDRAGAVLAQPGAVTTIPVEGAAEATTPPVARAAQRDTVTAAPPSRAASTASTRQHTIRSGDTLDAIAKRYGVTVRALRAANPGLDPRRLIPGKRVRIP
jgi:D-alanyl-D-alanine carboxypeptidase/D-alanyl-D-alanine-endopeptidase (penicillin-binding protein 4)